MSRPLWSAWLKGMDAGLAGETLNACPYKDKRKPSGRLTWSRAFQNAWRDGWVYATTNREQALITSRYRAYPGPRCPCVKYETAPEPFGNFSEEDSEEADDEG